MPGMRLITCHFTLNSLRKIRELVKMEEHPNMSSTIRFAVQLYLVIKEPEIEEFRKQQIVRGNT